MKHIYFLTFILISTFGFSQSTGDIIITEIMINPLAVSDTNGEWFEVYNTTTIAIDMNGWIIKDLGTNNHTINTSLIVPAEGFAVLARSGTVTNGGAPTNYIITSSFGVANSEDEVILQLPTPSSVIIDQVNYSAALGFTFPNGKSINLNPTKFNATDNDLGSNWCESTSSFGDGDLGTPKLANDSCETLSTQEFEKGLSIELYPNPTSNGFVNITTTSNEAVNVSIFDILGKQVLAQKVNNNTINVSNLNSGVYILKLNQNGATITKKLVVK